MNSLVSIITANYNKAAYIGETILSVQSQNYSRWEMIIVDDCSSDDSTEKIQPFLIDTRIRLIRNDKNKGGNFCRNIGLERSTGDYVIFLDADDLLSGDCLKRRMEAAEKFKDCNLLIFSMGVFYVRPGDCDLPAWTPESSDPLRDFLRHRLPWSILQPLWRSDLIKELGGFDTGFSRLQDVELSTRALLHKKTRVTLIGGKPDCFYRIDEKRKNFSATMFLDKWVEAVNRYTEKFKPELKPSLKKNLMGTVFEAYIQLLVYLKRKELNVDDFSKLKKRLLEQNDPNRVQRYCFSLVGHYNLNWPRVPGINYMLKRLLIVCG